MNKMKLIISALQRINRKEKFESVCATQRAIATREPRAEIPQSLREICEIEHDWFCQREIITLSPKNQSANRHLLYLHGGGYVFDLVKPHWQLIEYLIKNASVSVTVPIYQLAPQGTLTSELPIMLQVYEKMRENHQGKCFIAGDSAGGNFAMILTLTLRDKGLPLPDDVFLFSPWLDLNTNNPNITPELQAQDPMLAVDGARWCAKLWANGADLNAPNISPIFADLTALPPLHIHQGTSDIFCPDAQKFAQKAHEQGAICHLHLYENAFHVFIAIPNVLPEAKMALDKVVEVMLA